MLLPKLITVNYIHDLNGVEQMTNTQTLKVLVYGGTGSQASPTARHLLAQGHQPYVLTRNPEKAAPLVAAGAIAIAGDLADADSLGAASEGMDAVALLIPAFLDNPMAATDYAKAAIAAAVKAGVQHIVWNTSGPMPTQRTGHPMNDSRLDVLDYLQASGISHVVLVPTAYTENLLGPWTRPAVIQHNRVSYPVLEDRIMGWIASDDVGKLVAAALERPALAGSVFQISGIEGVTGPQLAAIFSEGLGRPISYYAMTPEEMGAAIESVFGPGSGEQVAASYRADQQDPNPTVMHHPMDEVLAQLPVKMTTLLEWVKSHAALYSA